MKALVTGGAGFIGSHLVQALVHHGASVAVIDDLSTGKIQNLDQVHHQITLHQASITNPEAVLKAAAHVDTVFHLAAVSNVPQTIDQPLLGHQVNATGTLHVLEAARANQAHVVYSSSAAVYGNPAETPVHEDLPLRTLSPYGSQKLLGELYLANYCQLFGLSGVSLRYFNVYGPRQRPDNPYSGVISKFIDRARQNLPLLVHGDGSQTRDFVNVQDVVQANILAAQARHIQAVPLNIGTGADTSILDLANLITSLYPGTPPPQHQPARPGDIVRSTAKTVNANQVIRFTSQVSLTSGIEQLTKIR